MEKANSRRKLMKSALTLGALSLGTKALAEICSVTPEQPEGPFYPVKDQIDKDADLTQVKGHRETASGRLIYIRGVVTDENCKPVSGAIVEIWQACATGKYNHPGDVENPATLDPHFQYWAQVRTSADGSYGFKTILPGAYPAGDGWIRPPHIHFKVQKLGFHDLITQMYFAGQPHNNGDRILRSLTPAERHEVIVKLGPVTPDLDPNGSLAHFDIKIKRA